MKKQYSKTGLTCKVTFGLPAEAVPGADIVTIAGDFNGWNRYEAPLKRQKNGGFSVTLELECGRQYRFRYLIDDSRWENDWNADGYIANPFGGEDSVVAVAGVLKKPGKKARN
ncbi:MAG: isoamylase early set domain-containing protein [Nitrospiraceae bacterium]|nr:isoamylase early set domain-containing protein [Nitrospiraceae bacterium]